MEKKQKKRLGIALVIVAIIIAASLIYSYQKTHNNQDVPSSVTLSQDIKDQEKKSKEKKLDKMIRSSKEKKLDKVIRSVQFTDKFYPCSLYDNIDYWVTFAEKQDIKLFGRFAFSDFIWVEIPYNKAQYYLDMGYVIILDLPKNSSYIKLQSGKEYIKTPEKKMAVKLP
jgi:Tfp pilus assembly major pilin PilA